MGKLSIIHVLVATMAVLCLAAVIRFRCSTARKGRDCQTSAPMVLNCEEYDYTNIHSAMSLVGSIRKLIGEDAEPSETQRHMEAYLNAFRKINSETRQSLLEWYCSITNAVGNSGELYYFDCDWVVKNGDKISSFDDLLGIPSKRNGYHFDKLHYVDPRIFHIFCERQIWISNFTLKSLDRIRMAIGHDFSVNKMHLLETLLEIESVCENLTLRGKPWFEELTMQLEEYGLDRYDENGSYQLHFSSKEDVGMFIIRRGPFAIKRIKFDIFIPNAYRP